MAPQLLLEGRYGELERLLHRVHCLLFSLLASGAALGLPRGRYAFSGRYTDSPAIWVIAYESIDVAIGPVTMTSTLTGIVGLMSFLFSLLVMNRFARRISPPPSPR